MFDGKQIREISADNAGMIVEGQTSGEWYPLGNFRFPKGNRSFIEISNKGANGIVTADAVLLIPEK